MGILSRNKDRKKPLINYRKWMDYERIKTGGQAIRDYLSLFAISHKPSQAQTLQKTMQRYHLSDEMIEQRKREFLHLFFIMCFVTFCIIAYSFYLLITRAYLGALMGLSLSLISLSLCFRYHFWYFQLKQRKLGCTFREWFEISILGKKK